NRFYALSGSAGQPPCADDAYAVQIPRGVSHKGGLPALCLRPAPLVNLDHAAAPAVSSSPSRALLKAVIATSSMSSEGSRVVNFCVPSTGRSATRTIGL